MLTVSELKSVLKKYGITPKKYFGQSYLVDSDVIEDIIEASKFVETDWVMEIGAGLGAITERLAREVKHVLAIEKDRNACAALGDILREFTNVNIVCQDFLELDLEGALSESPYKVKVIGNIPYYITTPIIEKLITNSSNFETILLTIQKEVAERICAKPGSKDYGSLSVFVQFYTKPFILLNINKRAFYPEPEVDSSFVELSVLQKPAVQVNDTEKFFAVVRAGFGQRRKTLLNSLLSSQEIKLDKAGLAELLKNTGIDPNIRAEQLSLEEFSRIANAV